MISLERRPVCYPGEECRRVRVCTQADVLLLDDICSSQWRESNPAFVRA